MKRLHPLVLPLSQSRSLLARMRPMDLKLNLGRVLLSLRDLVYFELGK